MPMFSILGLILCAIIPSAWSAQTAGERAADPARPIPALSNLLTEQAPYLLKETNLTSDDLMGLSQETYEELRTQIDNPGALAPILARLDTKDFAEGSRVGAVGRQDRVRLAFNQARNGFSVAADQAMRAPKEALRLAIQDLDASEAAAAPSGDEGDSALSEANQQALDEARRFAALRGLARFRTIKHASQFLADQYPVYLDFGVGKKFETAEALSDDYRVLFLKHVQDRFGDGFLRSMGPSTVDLDRLAAEHARLKAAETQRQAREAAQLARPRLAPTPSLVERAIDKYFLKKAN